MSTTTSPLPTERIASDQSLERKVSSERRAKVHSFINEVLKPADKTLGESRAVKEAVTSFEARPYQVEAFDALWSAREAGSDRALIHLATGLGKTSVAVFDYAKFRAEQAEKGESARALFVVHQNAILDQADERFNEILPNVLPGVGMSRFSNQASELPSGEVVFASFQALNRGASKFPVDYFDYIVYDEAHHIEAKTYKSVVEHFQPKFQLGLTATPERGDDKDITDHFGEAVYTKTLPEAIAEEYLANVHYRLMLDKQTKQLIQGGFRPKSMKELKEIFNFEPRLEDIADEIKAAQQELREKTGLEKIKTIIFNADIQTANEMAELLGGQSYHSERNKSDKDEVLRAFRNGDLETIVTRDMFNEGVDVPDALLLIFCRSTQSKTIFEQQLGRGLRKTVNKDEVTVLDFVANAERIRLIRELGKIIKDKCAENHKDSDDEPAEDTEIIDDYDTELKIAIGKSDFEFGQELVDILALYDYFIEQNENRVDWSGWTKDDFVRLALEISPDKRLGSKDLIELSRQRRFPSINLLTGDGLFGSITDFQRACGFEVKERIDWQQWSNTELIELAGELSPDGPLSQLDLTELSKLNEFPGGSMVAKRFGSIVEFQRACGFDVRENADWSGLTNDEILALAHNLSPNTQLKSRDLEQLAKDRLFPDPKFIAARFGSVIEFQRACGFDVIDWDTISNNELIELAKQLSPDKPLGSRDMVGNLFPNEKVIAARFGSVIEFQRACGFDVKERTNWTNVSNEEIVKLAGQISPAKKITVGVLREISKDGQFPSLLTIQKRFGSLTKFQKACGFTVD